MKEEGEADGGLGGTALHGLLSSASAEFMSETGTVLRDQGVVVRNGLGFVIAVMSSPGHSSLSCPSLVQHKNSPASFVLVCLV